MPNKENPTEAELKFQQMQETIEKDLRENEKYKTYFEAFLPASVDAFIKNIASKKAAWLRDGEFCIKANEEDDMRWINEANLHLEIIQQKKLFDLQCQWRAETVIIKEVEIAFDFYVWEKNVLQCPFIEPINKSDITLYQSYLATAYIDTSHYMPYGWQTYEMIKDADQTEKFSSHFPEWYHFHNLYTGAGAYLLLPDIRGKKEKFYREKDKESKPKEIIVDNWEHKSKDTKPDLLIYDEEEVAYFVKTFQDPITKQNYKSFKHYRRNSDDYDEVYDMLIRLYNAKERIPIEAHADFKEALRQAEKRFAAHKISEFLPYAFEEYKIGQSMGFGQSEERQKIETDFLALREKYWAPYILNGRKICGEPEDFNF